MSWQEQIEGKTLDEAVTWLLSLVEGVVVDQELYEDVWNPWPDPEILRLHRLWVVTRRPDGELWTWCADIEVWDGQDEPFFARRIMGTECGPWGVPPPPDFGHRKQPN